MELNLGISVHRMALPFQNNLGRENIDSLSIPALYTNIFFPICAQLFFFVSSLWLVYNLFSKHRPDFSNMTCSAPAINPIRKRHTSGIRTAVRTLSRTDQKASRKPLSDPNQDFTRKPSLVTKPLLDLSPSEPKR